MRLKKVNIRTNVRAYMYSHTYVRDRPYIPSTTLLCEGIKMIILIISEHPFRVVLGRAYHGLTGWFLLLRNFCVAISVSSQVRFI